MGNMKELRVWWIPQVPMKPFHVPVDSIQEAVKIMDTLAQYDLFQFENNIKPDYCNTGGVEEFNTEHSEWVSWYDEETDIDNPIDYIEHIESLKSRKRK